MSDLSNFIETAQHDLAPILDRSGNILYSAADTLRPGSIYLLGLNPGGDPTKHQTVRQTLDALASKVTNAYLDERWERHYHPGHAPLQRRIQWLAHEMGLDLRKVCATNLIFVRSKDGARSGYPSLADVCWPIHLAILELVQPKLIIAFGNSSVSPYAYLRRRLNGSPEKTFPSGHGSWLCRVFRSAETRVVGLPHLSRYAVHKHPEVGIWLRSFLSA